MLSCLERDSLWCWLLLLAPASAPHPPLLTQCPSSIPISLSFAVPLYCLPFSVLLSSGFPTQALSAWLAPSPCVAPLAVGSGSFYLFGSLPLTCHPVPQPPCLSGLHLKPLPRVCLLRSSTPSSPALGSPPSFGKLPALTPPQPFPLPCSLLIEMLMRLLSLPSLAGRWAGSPAQPLHLSGEGEERLGCQIQLERNQSQSSRNLGVGSWRQPRPPGARQSWGSDRIRTQLEVRARGWR